MASKPLPPSEPVFMDKRVWKFLRAWPNDLDPEIFDWLVEARVIASSRKELETTGYWPNGPCLTNLGYPLKAMIDSQSVNHFGLESLLALWPVELLALRRDDCTEFLRILQLDWNDPDVRRYIARGLDREKAVTGTAEFDPEPSRVELRLKVTDNVTPGLEKVSLLTAVLGLEIALAELLFVLNSGSYFHVE